MQALPGASGSGIGRNNGSASASGSPRGGGSSPDGGCSGTECGGLPLQLPTERSDHPRDPSEDDGDDLVQAKALQGFSLHEWWERTVTSSKLFLERHRAVKHFLHAIKSGDTGSALLCLANQPFLLAYHTFAKDGDTVWHLLAEYGDTSLLSALTNFCKIHTPPKRFQKAKYMSGGKVDCDAMILSFMNATNQLKQTPLMFAAYHGRDEVIRFLLRNGADAWSKDRCGSRAALHYASMRGHAACVHALLEALPEAQKERNGLRYVDVQSASGFTPLHFGISVDSLQVTRALLAFDACIDMFNVFDAGEFWLSCVTRSTALHLCAISNRIYCAGAILHYWEQNRVALKLEDPRLWRDAKGRLPVAIAQVKGHEALEKALVPGADVRPLKQYMPEISDSVVLRLKAIAAQVLKEQMVASIKEAEEFMKLLGTYQQHGRVFARRAYDAHSTEAAHRNDAIPASAGESFNMFAGHAGSYGSIATHAQPTLVHQRGSMVGAVKTSNSACRGRDGCGSNDGGACVPQPVPRAHLQAALKQWVSYERKAIERGVRGKGPRLAMQERSALSQLNPDDSSTGCFHGLVLTLTGRNGFLPPQPGEDVCGMCQDNKPLLQMCPCSHRTCLLCAKSMCLWLDMQQLVLCPYCGSVVTCFTLA